MATSDSPLSVPNVTLAVARAASGGGGNPGAPDMSGLSLVSEPGFTVTGTLADLGEITISGQDFGTKPPVRHFDRIDRYWDNGTEVVDPYATRTEGDSVPNQSQVADSPFPASGTNTDFNTWLLRQEAARRGRDFGYQLDADATGGMSGTTNAGFAGWPATQRDAHEVYIRYWRWMEYFGTDADINGRPVLVNSLAAGATSATIDDGISELNSGNNNRFGLEELYIELDDGTMFPVLQQLPRISTTEFNFTPALPQPAAAGNAVHLFDNDTMKCIRLRDDPPPGMPNMGYNKFQITGFQGSISNLKWPTLDGYNERRWTPGKWELHEYYIRIAEFEADWPDLAIARTRIDGELIMDRAGAELAADSSYPSTRAGVAWPSSGLGITNFGFEEDRTHAIPGNFYRLSDLYFDSSRQRIEIGIGNDDLYQCSNREPCPIKTWNGDITFNLNALPFDEAEMAQARIFVVGSDDTATLVGRIQQ